MQRSRLISFRALLVIQNVALDAVGIKRLGEVAESLVLSDGRLVILYVLTVFHLDFLSHRARIIVLNQLVARILQHLTWTHSLRLTGHSRMTVASGVMGRFHGGASSIMVA